MQLNLKTIKLTTSALVLLGSNACQLKLQDENLGSSKSASVTIDFCQEREDSSTLWNAPRVQKEIRKLIDEPNYRRSGLAAYAEVYQAMTKERDKSRCDSANRMYPPTALQRRLNDVLADLMTKTFVISQRACLKSFVKHSSVIPAAGEQLCQLSRESASKHQTTFQLAMGSTAYYLTSIMGMSLSALPHVKAIWQDTEYRQIQDRIDYLKTEYKTVFDVFNLFLANNLPMIAETLAQQGDNKCSFFNGTARALKSTPIPEAVFAAIRSKTFELGVQLAYAWPLESHPYTRDGKSFTPDVPLEEFTSRPAAFDELAEHANRTAAIFQNAILNAVCPGQKIFYP